LMFMKSAAALDMISALGFTDFRELEAMVVGVSVSRLTVAARIQLRRVPNLQEERKRESCSHFLFRIRGKNRRRKQPIDDGLLEFPILRLSRLFACAPTFRKTAARKTGSPSKATADASALPFASARPPDSKQVRAFPELCYAPTDRARPAAARSRGRATRTARLAGRFLVHAFPIAERLRATKRRTLISRSGPRAATRRSPRRASARETSAKATRGDRARFHRGRRRDARG
jgi:hypothetical protein